MTSPNQIRFGKVLQYLLAIAALLILAPASLKAAEKSMERTITVSATGEVEAEPDAARINSGVMTTATTARDALDRNNKAMANVIDGLKSMGLKPRDIQTSSFHIEPRYQHNRDGRPAEIVGYQVTNQLNVTVRDIDELGEIMDQLITLGANQMHGLNFFVSNQEELSDDARVRAVENARRRAEIYAKAASADVGKVLSISEGAAHIAPVRHSARRATMAAESVPIERGTQSLTVYVTVTWELE